MEGNILSHCEETEPPFTVHSINHQVKAQYNVAVQICMNKQTSAAVNKTSKDRYK